MSLILTLSDISPDTWSMPITPSPQLVGRDHTAHIHLESRFVSKHHCKIWMDGETCFVEDLGSMNGTYVAGERIKRVAIKSGDRVLVGNFELLVADESQILPTDPELLLPATLYSQDVVSTTEKLLAKPAAIEETPNDVQVLAAAVHSRLTPSRRIGLPGMLIEVAYFPSGLLGGDSFECLELEDRWALALFDSMNHGSKAALTISLIRSELNRWISLIPEPARCLEHLNEELVKLKIDDLYVCGGLAMWFPVTSTMVYATAGQHPPMWLRDDKVLNPDEMAGGLPLGVAADTRYEEKLLQLRPKDRLFFFSDGLRDAFRGRSQAGPVAGRLAREVLTRTGEGLRQQAERIVKAQKDSILDDALLVACEVGDTGAREE